MSNVNLSLIVLAFITAFIGYQFNLRAKRKERFLNELKNSYNKVYSPMYEMLQTIVGSGEEKKYDLIEEFISTFTRIDSNIRYIGSSKLLEEFYDLRSLFHNTKKEGLEDLRKELFNKVNSFYKKIESEFWDAHDIIYEDHLQYTHEAFINPFLAATFEVLRTFYHFTTFALGVSFLILYFAIYSNVIATESTINFITIGFAVVLVIFMVLVYLIMLMIRTFTFRKNRRTKEPIYSLIKRLINRQRKDSIKP